MYTKFKQPHHMHMSVIYNNFDNVGELFYTGRASQQYSLCTNSLSLSNLNHSKRATSKQTIRTSPSHEAYKELATSTPFSVPRESTGHIKCWPLIKHLLCATTFPHTPMCTRYSRIIKWAIKQFGNSHQVSMLWKCGNIKARKIH